MEGTEGTEGTEELRPAADAGTVFRGLPGAEDAAVEVQPAVAGVEVTTSCW